MAVANAGSWAPSRTKALVRFDVVSGQVSTLDDVAWDEVWLVKAGLLHVDFRLPSVDYSIFLRTTRLMTRRMPASPRRARATSSTGPPPMPDRSRGWPAMR